MAAAAVAPTVSGSVARADTTIITASTTSTTSAAAAATTSTTAPEAAAVTLPTTATTAAAAAAEQTTQREQTTTPQVSNSPAAQSDPVTSSSSTSSLPVLSSQQTSITTSSSLSPVQPDFSSGPEAITSTTETSAPGTSNGLSNGAVAGIAIGCVIAGLIIGTLVAFFLLKRRSKSYPEADVVVTRNRGKSWDSRAFTATPVEPMSAVSDLDQFLLAPRPDTELAGELRSLGHLIQQHVEDNYHLLPLKRSISSLSQALTGLGFTADNKALPGPERLAELTADPKTRHYALQHVISRVIFESLALRSTSKLSLLPPAVSVLAREMPPCEKHLGNPKALSQALARWRQLSAFLLNPNRSERGSLVPDEVSLAPRARNLAVAMNNFLEACVEERNVYFQESHLHDVVLECAKLGYMVFSHPEELAWKFDSGIADKLVLCPGLEKMLTRRASTLPPVSSDVLEPQRTPRASLEHEARSEPRTSTSDEAQACFNLILILRHDTQHLIALRNDNIQSLEETTIARPLLTGVNDAITAATRSIHELGPFLERHRWPTPPESPSRSPIRLKMLRKRSRSFSTPSIDAGTPSPSLSPEELFERTLALTAEHSAVLSALGNLEEFLMHGTAALNEEDRRRHDATQSWWQQRRSEFENVGLIQSILQGPRKNPNRRSISDGSGAAKVPAAVCAGSAEEREIGVAVTASSPTAILPSISEHDDARSETATFSELSIRSAPSVIIHGLSARPRPRAEAERSTWAPGSQPPPPPPPPCESPDAERLAGVGPWPHLEPSPAVSEAQTAGETQRPSARPTPPPIDTTSTSTPIPRLPLSRYSSDESKRPRAPLPPLIGLQALISTTQPDANLSALSVSPCSPCSPSSPSNATNSPLTSTPPPGTSQNSSSRASPPSPLAQLHKRQRQQQQQQQQQQASPTAETPYTPLDQHVMAMFTQRTLPTKKIQPVVHELGGTRMSVGVEYKYRGGGGEGGVQGEEDADDGDYGGGGDDDDRHWPYLAYMARKQAVATSRWSLRRTPAPARREG
ncbi:hypothetical protein SLS53_000542 [Cytospora paraplurivora]|uniref:Uncharacterized protein n=1 Tax=Cytospora paraplurivora TaxID=2898453 RepID=A0AAN9UTY4_9PEZI